MKDITPILQSLGLLDSEIKTYLSALDNGAGTVVELTKQTHLSRQATYVAINLLMKRGLMSSVLRAKKRMYMAEHPDKLLAYAKRRQLEMHDYLTDLERMVPELELQMGGDRPVVHVFEGKEGLKAIIDDMRVTDFKESVEIADMDALKKVLSQDDLKGMRMELKKRGVFIHGLYAGEVSEKTVDSNRLILPKEYSGFKADIGVYGDKIELITFEGKMYSVIIESKLLARTLHILFELALKGAKDFEKK